MTAGSHTRTGEFLTAGECLRKLTIAAITSEYTVQVRIAYQETRLQMFSRR